MIELQLTASAFQLELYVDGYEFPDFNTGRDANALTCEIELDPHTGPGPPRRSQPAHPLHLRAGRLRRSAPRTRTRPQRRSDARRPRPTVRRWFGLTIRLKDGQDTLDGFLADSTTTRLSFEMIDIDRSFVRDTLAQFATILDAFPVRGDITAD